MSVIPNTDAPELSIDQYISMQLEKTIADAHPIDSRFNNVISVAELRARWHPFALSSTLTFGEFKIGEPSSTPAQNRATVTYKNTLTNNPITGNNNQTIDSPETVHET